MKRLKIATLDKGWHDKDDLLLHAAFQLLADFVEQEHPEKIVDWNANELHKSAWDEITACTTCTNTNSRQDQARVGRGRGARFSLPYLRTRKMAMAQGRMPYSVCAA